MKRWLPFITGIVLVAGLAWSFLYLRALHPFGSAVTDLDAEPLQNIGLLFKDATLVGWSNHDRIWQIHAKGVEVSRDRRRAVFKSVSNSYLMKGGERVASISADAVVYNMVTHNVSVPGSAELKVKDGPSLKTKSIVWHSARSRLACTGGVTVTVDGNTFHGDRMVADLEKKELTATRVRGVIRIPD